MTYFIKKMNRFIITLLIFNFIVSCASATERKEKMSEEELLETVQRQTFRYFWEYACPDSKMVRERSWGGAGRYELIPFDRTYFRRKSEENSKKGLRASYFNNMYLRGEPALERTEKNIDVDWGRGSPADEINKDHFSALWKGYIVFPESGEYRIGLGSDDGSRLYLDGELLIDNWRGQSFNIESKKVDVKKGKPYNIRLEYFEEKKDAAIKLGYMKKIENPEKAKIDIDPRNNIVATGGTGMGVMTIIVGSQRGWVTREEAAQRVLKIVEFLENADSFFGVFPHWLDGSTGKTIPFSDLDDGADLVETALLFQGLLTAREYFTEENYTEQKIRDKIDRMWHDVEWDKFTREKNVLYWHYSPNHGWKKGHEIRGWDECLITYVLAASSPEHAIYPEVYHKGYAQGEQFKNNEKYFGKRLQLGPDYGGPLFFAHYSFLGMDPRGLRDKYADYWKQNVAHTLINRAHCIENPNGYDGYGKMCWGLTASDNYAGYSDHSPTNDLGVITPTAALSSMPYTPEYSMEVLKHFYYNLGGNIWGRFGFIDSFSKTHNWYSSDVVAINQAPIIIMIENYRTGLLWDVFMRAPEVKEGLERLGFEGNF